MGKFFLICVAYLLTASAYAAEGWGVGLSYIYAQMNYKEPALMNEKGKMKGIGIDSRFDLGDLVSLSLQGRFLTGNLEYSGSTFSGIPISQTTKDKVTEYRALAYFRLGDWAPYTGYGYRYWYNDLVISYRRETTYNYMPIGLRYIWRPLYLNYEFRHFLGGVNESHMSDIAGSGRKDVTMKQKSGKGYALEGGYLVEIGDFDLKISLAYEYWGIEKSETANDGVDTLIEPHNSTNTYLLSVGLYY